MEDNEKKESTATNNEPAENYDMVDDIEAWKATTVAKSKFDEVLAQRNKAYRVIMNGGSLGDTGAPAKRSHQSIIDDLLSDSVTNRVKCQALIDAVDEYKEKGIDNICYPRGKYSAPTPEDKARHDDTIANLRALLEEANGDDAYFNILYDRHTI